MANAIISKEFTAEDVGRKDGMGKASYLQKIGQLLNEVIFPGMQKDGATIPKILESLDFKTKCRELLL